MKKLLVISLVAAAAAAATVAPPAHALSPCARALINDWYDGRIDKAYKPRCYRDAIRYARANPDIRVYSSLEADLLRALRRPLKHGVVPAGAPGRRAARIQRQTLERERKRLAALQSAASSEGAAASSNDGSSAPLPLIVLGGAGLLLLAAGLAGYVRRWFGGGGGAGGDPPAAQA